MKVSDKFVLRQVAGEWIVLPVAEKTVDFNGMLTLNETGFMLWKLLEKGATRNEIVSGIAKEYGAEESEIDSDVDEVLQGFKNIGVING